MDRLARVRKPVIAQVEGFAVGGGLGIAAGADLRIATPDARFGAPIARTLGNCLSMRAYARYLDLFGASRLKELIFTARLLTADEALAAGFVHEIVPADRIAARVRELAQTVASHAPITLWVTKERSAASRTSPDGDGRPDLRQRRFPKACARSSTAPARDRQVVAVTRSPASTSLPLTAAATSFVIATRDCLPASRRSRPSMRSARTWGFPTLYASDCCTSLQLWLGRRANIACP
jgi:enoyl-CoA hydratase/carnithine racemase